MWQMCLFGQQGDRLERQLRQARALALLEILQQLGAHARLPVLVHVILDITRRLLRVVLAREEGTDLVQHFYHQIGIHVRRPGCA
jgi:hypothetical protein